MGLQFRLDHYLASASVGAYCHEVGFDPEELAIDISIALRFKKLI